MVFKDISAIVFVVIIIGYPVLICANLQCSHRSLMSKHSENHLLLGYLAQNLTVRSLADCQITCLTYKLECGCTSIAYDAIIRRCYIISSSQENPHEKLTLPHDVIIYERTYYRDCDDVRKRKGSRKDGVYQITPTLSPCDAFFVYCEMNVEGTSAWTVFQRRFDGSVNFNQKWKNYAYGFGDLCKEFWLGNEHIHKLSSSGIYRLKIDMKAKSDSTTYKAVYESFSIGNESEKYQMNIGGLESDLSTVVTDGLIHHQGIRFSTIDQDNDERSTGNCAEDYLHGWWFNQCFNSNLNAYGYWAFVWDYAGEEIELKYSVMKIQRND